MEEKLNELQEKINELSETVETLYSMIKVHDTRLDVLNTLMQVHHKAIEKQAQFNANQILQNRSFSMASEDMRKTDQVRYDSDVLAEK